MRFRCNNRDCETILCVLAIAAIALALPLHAQTIQVKSNQKIADNTGGFGVTLTNSDEFGIDVDDIGDLDNDGVADLIVGARRDDTGGTDRGAVYVLFMNSNGTVKSSQKIADNTGGFSVTLTDDDRFGQSVAGIGDVDNDGVEDIAVGASLDDTGGTARGAIYVLLMNTNGTVKSSQKVADNTAGFNVTLADNDQFGVAIAGLGDLDNDGVEDIAVGANKDDTGGTDRGAFYVLFLNNNGTIKSWQEVADNTGGFGVTLTNNDGFGISLGLIGDLDNDGVQDMVVGASQDDTGETDRGAAYVLLMNTNGTVKSSQKIAADTGGLNTALTDSDNFGRSVAGLDDLNGDGVEDLAIGADLDETGGADRGAVYVLSMNTDGTVKSAQKIADNTNGFDVTLTNSDGFGIASADLGDLDGDGVVDFVAGARRDNTGGADRGAVYIVYLKEGLSISSISPTSGKVGDSVTITGTSFDTTPSNNTVYFGATKATVTSASATSLTATVPSGASFGPTKVQVGSRIAESDDFFLPTYTGVAQTIAAGTIAQKIDFTTGTGPRIPAIGDLDGDGMPDIAVANQTANTVSVFRNTSISGAINSSSYAAKVDFAANTATFDVVIADVDGDGKLDLATANSANTVSVLRNTSTAGTINGSSFATKVDFVTDLAPAGLYAADLDGDGKQDIVTANQSANTVSLLRNTSSSGSITASSFATKVDLVTGSMPRRVTVGDIDGDEKPDLVVANEGSDNVSVLRNTTIAGVIDASSFAPKVDFATGTLPQKAAIGDVDGDGKLDLAVTNQTANTVSVLRNTGSIGSVTFAPKVDFTTGAGPFDVALGDLDGDGKPDLSLSNLSAATLSMLRNMSTVGSVSFAGKVDVSAGASAAGVVAGDMDGDGKPEIVVASFTPNTVSVYHNIADPPTVSSISPVSGKVGDVVTITGTNFSTTPASNVVWFGGAQATVTSASTTSLTVTVPDGVTHDRVSVTVNNRTAVSDEYFLPTFDTEFPTIDASSLAAKVDFTTGTNPFDVHLADLDGDGKAEMLVPNSGDNTVSLFRNTGSSGTISFAGKVDLTSNNGVQNMNVGDLDGDGELDFAVANWMVNAVSVFRNTSTVGSLSFAPRDDFNTDLAPESVGIDDFDGDGKLDLAICNNNAGANSVSVLRNTGTLGSMSFATKVDFAAVNQPYEIAVGDLDGDGKPDMAVSNQSSNDVSVFRNTSTAGVIDASSFAAKVDFTVGVGSSGMEFGDIDGDGKLDMSASTQGGAKITLFRNLSTPGTVSFAAGFDLGASKPLLMSFGDVDGDGKLDLASAERTGFHKLGVYRNTATSGMIDANTFAPVVEFTPGTDPFGVAIGDLDGDGKPDVAVANLASNNVSVYRNLTLSTPAPTISSISPTSGKVGDAVTITGTNFSTTPANNTVWFGGAQATVTSASATSLTVSVPAGATFDRVSVTVNNRTAQSDDFFMTTFNGEFPTIDESSLADKVDFGAATAPNLIAVGDVDGDGKLDMAVANNNSDDVSVFRNTGSSGTVSFATKVDYAANVDPFDVAFGDLDGDGELDMAVSSWGSGTVSVLRNLSTLGSVAFAAKVDYTAGSSPVNTAVGDLDGDGKLDLAVVASADNAVAVLRNTSVPGTIDASSFAAKVDFATAAGANDPAIGDLDGDGVPDLAVVARAGSQISVLRNTATPGVIDASSFATNVDFKTDTSPQEVVIADLDGDSKYDMAIQNLASINISVYHNTSTLGTIDAGSFAARVNFATSTGPEVVAAGDIDGDGKLDLATANYNASTVSVFRNTSTVGTINTSSFSPKVDFTAGGKTWGIAIADLDGDDSPDVAASNNHDVGATISVFRNLTTTTPLPTISTFSPVTGRVGKTISITGTNFDATAASNTVHFGATKANVSAATSTSLTVDVPVSATFSPITVNRNNRIAESGEYFLPTFSSGSATIDASTFASKLDFTTDTSPYSDVAVGDLDGDGKPDLAVPNFNSTTVSVFRNTSASGTISLASKVDFTAGTAPWGVDLGDTDGDGKLDLVATSRSSTTASVFRNTSTSGSISFAAKVDLTTDTNPEGVSVGDLDGDGKLDIAVADKGTDRLSVFRNVSNPGGAAFELKVDFIPSAGPEDVAIADVDGDGRNDLIASHSNSSTVSIFRNIGSPGTIDGSFFDTKVDLTAGSAAFGMSLGDVDGDSKLDIAVANNGTNTMSVFRNTGSSGSVSFAAKQDFTTGNAASSVAMGDLNGDGKLDLAATSFSSNTVSLFRNTATSGTIDANSFAAKVDLTTGTSPFGVSIADLDGDGRTDVEVANSASNTMSVYRNKSVLQTTGHVGKATIGAGGEIQLFSIGLTSFGTFTLTSIDLTISDLDAPTGLISNDLDLVLYRSSDETFDNSDTQIGLESTINIGSATTVSPAATETPTGHNFYIITARINTVIGEEGHAFKVGFDLNGVSTTAGTEGAAITASESNTVTFEVVADHWEFTSQPTNTTHLELFSPQPFLEARDQHGNRDQDFNGPVTLALSPSGTLSQSDFTAADGRVVIDSLSVSGAGDGRTLTATGLGLTGTSNSFDVAKADATVTLNNLDAKSDGNPKVGGATTDPPGLAVVFTHNDFGVPLASPPIDPGSYGVTATVNDPNYQGSATGTLTIFLAEPPRAVFSASTLQGNPPLTVTFTDQSTGPIETWFLEPKADDSRVYEDRNQEVTVTYSTPGAHTVFLTVRGVGITHQSSLDIIVNGPPDLAKIADATANEDETLELDLSAIDAESGTWTLAGADQTLISASSIQGNKIEFTPVTHANGSDVVTITRTNIHSLSTSQDVTLTWAPVDDAPTIVDLASRFSAAEDNPIHVGAVANVTDLDSDVATLLWSASGFDGVLVGSTTPSNTGVDLAPVVNAFGETEATIVVTDPATGTTVTQEVTLVWTRVNDQPSPPVVGFPADGMADTPLAPLFSWSARDVDFDALVFDLFLGPTGATLEQVASRLDATSFSSSELSPGISYTWKVVVQDQSGATSEASFTFTTEADLRAPLVANVRTAPTEASVAFNWNTDEPATSRVQLTTEDGGPATAVANPTQLDPSTVEISRSDLVREHQLTADNLRAGTWYRYEIRSTDAQDNQSNAFLGRVLTLSAPDGTAPLFLVDPYIEGLTAARATVRWRTDEPADSRVRFTRLAAAKTALVSQESASEIILDELTEDHIVELAALETGADYSFEAQSADASGNLSTVRSGSFTTGIEADETAPEFTAGPAATAITNGSAFIALEADELGTVQIRFDTDEEISDGQLVGGTQTQSEHQIQLLGLEPSTRYFFQVLMRDASGNETRSSVRDFETRAAPDEISAEILAGPAIEALTDQSAVLVLTADEPVRVQLLVSTDPNLDGAVLEESGELQMSHTLQLTNLAANTDYFYEVLVRDGANNQTPAATGSFHTLTEGENLPPEIVELFAEGVGFDRAAVIWRTSEPTTGSLRFEVEGTAAATGAGAFITIVEPARHHRAQLTQLGPRTGYRITALALDAQGNGVERSFSLRTRGEVDARPPLIETGPNVQGISAFAAVVEVTYNEPVELNLRYAANADLSDAAALSSVERKRTHRIDLTGLDPGTTYWVGLAARDQEGNSDDELVLTFTTDTEPDQTPPAFVTSPFATDLSSTFARVRLELDEPASVELVASTSEDLSSPTHARRSLERRQRHALELTNLRSDTPYFFRVTAEDADRNLTISPVTRFESLSRTQQPVQLTAGPVAQRIGDRSATVFFRLDRAAEAVVTYSPVDEPEDEVSENRGLATDHNVVLSNLAPGTEYAYTVGFGADGEATGSFRTETLADTKPPKFFGPPVVVDRKHDRVRIEWDTDEVADSEILFSAMGGASAKALAHGFDRVAAAKIMADNGGERVIVPADVKSHEVVLTNLTPGTRFLFQSFCTDPAGNRVEWPVLDFLTSAGPDIAPPVMIGRPIVRGLTQSSFLVAFSTNEPSTANLRSADGVLHLASGNQETNHELRAVGLVPETTYELTVCATDASGNGPTCSQLAVTTRAAGDRRAPRINTGPIVIAAGAEEVVVELTSDEPTAVAVTYLSIGDGANGAVERTVQDPEFRTFHRVVLSGLEPGASYGYTATVTDVAGNANASAAADFTTAEENDSTAPAITSGPSFQGITENGVTIVWTTDEPASSLVDWSIDAASAKIAAASSTSQRNTFIEAFCG